MNHTESTAAPVDWAKAQRWAILAAIVGFGAFAGLGILNVITADAPRTATVRQFFLSYLVGFIFWAGITTGAMALRTIHHLCGTSWGVLLRPGFYAATGALPVVALLFIPVGVSMFLGDNSPYWWAGTLDEATQHTNEEGVAELREKHDDYLSPGFTIARAVVYFAFWGVMAFLLNRRVAADREGDPAAHEYLKNVSGPLLMLWAVFGTFAATDWVMSLERNWSSTMFPVIFGVTHLLTGLVFSSVVLMSVVHHAPLAGAVRDKHKIDIGSLTLALTMVWSYTSFSQFLLVWVGNLPEEIPFFLKRTTEGWEWISRALCVLFFALPFLLLLFRDIKKQPHRLRLVQLHLLCMAFLNVLWWIDPSVSHAGMWLHVPMDVAATVGVGGVWCWAFFNKIKQVPLLTPYEAHAIQGEHHHSHAEAAGHAHPAHGHAV